MEPPQRRRIYTQAGIGPADPVRACQGGNPNVDASRTTSASEPHSEPHRGGQAVLGKSVIVKGQIFSREDLTIDGEVEGTVELQEHRLTVGPNGKVLASVKAREIVVLGTIHGNVETTDKIDIRKEAKLVGDIKTARIVIEDGAYFKGNIDIVRAEAPRQAPARAQAAARRCRAGARPRRRWPREPAITSARSLTTTPALETRHSTAWISSVHRSKSAPACRFSIWPGANQATISFMTNYGHRLYSDDFVHQLDQCFGEGDFYENQSNPLMVREISGHGARISGRNLRRRAGVGHAPVPQRPAARRPW